MRPGHFRMACLLSIGDRYAARTFRMACLLSIGDRYAARVVAVVRVLSIGDRYAARTLPVVSTLAFPCWLKLKDHAAKSVLSPRAAFLLSSLSPRAAFLLSSLSPRAAFLLSSRPPRSPQSPTGQVGCLAHLTFSFTLFDRPPSGLRA
jgi:hypothetical protein